MICGVDGIMMLRRWVIHLMARLGNFVVMLQPLAACWQFFKFWWTSRPGTIKQPSDSENINISLRSFVFCEIHHLSHGHKH